MTSRTIDHIAVVAPMPSANVAMANSAKTGARDTRRQAMTRSFRGPFMLRNHLQPVTTRPRKSLKTLARPPRLELGTPGLEGRCSIQLSYGRTEERLYRANASERSEPRERSEPTT